MADRQWFLTKMVGSLLGIFLLVSSCIGAANMFFNLKRDVVRNEKSIVTHESSDKESWIDLDNDLSDIRGDIKDIDKTTQELRISQAEQTAIFGYIQMELEKINSKIDRLEVYE